MVDYKVFAKKKDNVISKPDMEEKLKKLRKEHDKLVKGKFEFIDAMGGWLEFSYRFFPDDLLTNYKFIHGEICEIPLGLVKHLNNTYKKIRNLDPNMSDRGVSSSYTTQSRVRFTPLEML